VLARRVGEHQTLYGSVTAADIAESLESQGFEIAQDPAGRAVEADR
jgi:ribosomal protein L9